VLACCTLTSVYFAALLEMAQVAQLIYYENRGFGEIIRMLMTLGDIEVNSSDARFTDIEKNTTVL